MFTQASALTLTDHARAVEKLDVESSKRFRVHHQGNEELARQIGKAADRHVDALSASIAPADFKRPRLKTFHIRVYQDREEYLKHGDASAAFAVAQCVSTTEIHTYESAALGALEHEITHLLVHAYLPSMPMWIQEGFATGGYSQAKARSYRRAKECLDSGRLLPFDRFISIHAMGTGGLSADLYYLQSRMVLEFLVLGRGGLRDVYRFGKEARRLFDAKLKKLRRSAPRGKKITVSTERQIEGPVRNALETIYGYADLEDLDKDFRAWLEHRVRESQRQESQRRKPASATFKHTAKLESKHFVIFTTSDEKLALRMIELAEKVYREFATEFWDTGVVMPGRLKIYLFDTSDEYAEFLRSLGMKLEFGKHLLPHYNAYAGAACVYRQGLTKDYLHQSLAHEVAHGLAGRLNSARRGGWVTEAIAYYVGLSVHAKTKRIELGECHETKLSRLASYVRLHARSKKLIPLASLVDATPAGMNTVAHRAQSWALFRFLQDADDGRYRDEFHRYLAELIKTGDGGVAVFEKHVGEISGIEAEFKSWALGLKPTSKKR